jgi:PEP-CTERM motif
MKCKAPLFTALLFCASAAIAAPITGTFQLNGIVTATPTMFEWAGVSGSPTDVFSLSLGTGAYAAEDGTNTIHDLNNVTEPVGTVFPPQDFIDFTVAPGVPALLINFVAMGNGGAAGCSAAASGTTPPQTCTPVIPGGSPITFQNNNVNGTVTGSSATWTFSGITNGGQSIWNGIFTSQFVGESYQQVLATFTSTGSVTASYSANITVSAVPEPGTLMLIGLGLLVMLPVCRRKLNSLR